MKQNKVLLSQLPHCQQVCEQLSSSLCAHRPSMCECTHLSASSWCWPHIQGYIRGCSDVPFYFTYLEAHPVIMHVSFPQSPFFAFVIVFFSSLSLFVCSQSRPKCTEPAMQVKLASQLLEILSPLLLEEEGLIFLMDAVLQMGTMLCFIPPVPIKNAEYFSILCLLSRITLLPSSANL